MISLYHNRFWPTKQGISYDHLFLGTLFIASCIEKNINALYEVINLTINHRVFPDGYFNLSLNPAISCNPLSSVIQWLLQQKISMCSRNCYWMFKWMVLGMVMKMVDFPWICWLIYEEMLNVSNVNIHLVIKILTTHFMCFLNTRNKSNNMYIYINSLETGNTTLRCPLYIYISSLVIWIWWLSTWLQ